MSLRTEKTCELNRGELLSVAGANLNGSISGLKSFYGAPSPVEEVMGIQEAVRTAKRAISQLSQALETYPQSVQDMARERLDGIGEADEEIPENAESINSRRRKEEGAPNAG